MSTLKEVAEALREGHKSGMEAGWRALSPAFAETVDLASVPPGPGDGAVPGETLVNRRAAVARALSKIKGFSFAATVEVEPGKIVERMTIHGETDKEPFDFHWTGEYLFDGDRIVRTVMKDDPDTHEQLQEAVKAAGGVHF